MEQCERDSNDLMGRCDGIAELGLPRLGFADIGLAGALCRFLHWNYVFTQYYVPNDIKKLLWDIVLAFKPKRCLYTLEHKQERSGIRFFVYLGDGFYYYSGIIDRLGLTWHETSEPNVICYEKEMILQKVHLWVGSNRLLINIEFDTRILLLVLLHKENVKYYASLGRFAWIEDDIHIVHYDNETDEKTNKMTAKKVGRVGFCSSDKEPKWGGGLIASLEQQMNGALETYRVAKTTWLTK